MEPRRLVITLFNGRSHIVELPETVAADDAAAVIRGERMPQQVGWIITSLDWLPLAEGGGWARSTAIAEITIVDYPSIDEI